MTLPTTDHRAAQTGVRNQGNRRSCVGFAVAAAHEWMAHSDMLSVEDVLWAGHQAGGSPLDEATSVHLALTGLDRYGHATEATWPYGAPAWPSDRPASAADPAAQRTLPPWQPLPDVSFSAIAAELDRGAAVVLTVGVVRSVWQQPGGVIDAEPGRKTRGNHAVVAVGVLGGPDAVARQAIVKNSWGTGWGLGGYGFISQRYTEVYGVRVHVMETTR
jgi:hypothetical protein